MPRSTPSPLQQPRQFLQAYQSPEARQRDQELHEQHFAKVLSVMKQIRDKIIPVPEHCKGYYRGYYRGPDAYSARLQDTNCERVSDIIHDRVYVLCLEERTDVFENEARIAIVGFEYLRDDISEGVHSSRQFTRKFPSSSQPIILDLAQVPGYDFAA